MIQIKTNISIKNILFVILVLLSSKTFCQDTTHTIVNTGNLHGLVPDYRSTIDIGQLKNKVTVYNGYNHTYKLFVSKDQKSWARLDLPNMQYAVFKLKKVYAKILSADSSSFVSELDASYIYALYYDFSQKKWVIQQKRKIE